MAVISDYDGAIVYLQISVPAAGSVAWADRVALPLGCAVMSVAGSVAVTVAFE